MKKVRAIFCWSGGKDSALALQRIQQENIYEIVCLLTTVNEEFGRVSMHGVREELLEMQAKEIGIPLEKIYIPKESTNEIYERKMEQFLNLYKAKGVQFVIFGDIFLEDLKVYRENNLAKVGLKAVFPLWKRDTKELINEFIDKGFQTVLCCTNNDYFDDSFVGREITKSFVTSLPSKVDPCGENGEFHTFAFAGPIFKNKINFRLGEKLLRTYTHKAKIDGEEVELVKGFWFIDLLPA